MDLLVDEDGDEDKDKEISPLSIKHRKDDKGEEERL